MNLPNWFRISWLILLVLISGILFARLGDRADPADVVIFLIWVAVLLMPLFSCWYQRLLAIPNVVPIIGSILVLCDFVLMRGSGPLWFWYCVTGVLPVFACLSLFSRQVWTSMLGWTYLILLCLLVLAWMPIINFAMLMASVEGEPRIEVTFVMSGQDLRGYLPFLTQNHNSMECDICCPLIRINLMVPG